MIDLELIAPEYCDEQLMTAPKRVYRRTTETGRMYFTIEPDGQVLSFPSVTTFIRSTMPMPYYLRKWMETTDAKEIEEKRDAASDYGSFMHYVFAQFVIFGKSGEALELSLVDQWANQWNEERHKNKYNASEWAQKAKCDLLAFQVWAWEYEVQPLAIEMPLTLIHPRPVAGSVDLICRRRLSPRAAEGVIKKTRGKRVGNEMVLADQTVLAVDDFKSPRKGIFGPDYVLQLLLYRQMVQANFPELGNVQSIANFAPKEWRDVPTYHFKQHDLGGGESNILPLLFQMYDYHKLNVGSPPVFPVGKIKWGSMPEREIYRERSFAEIVTYAHEMRKKHEPHPIHSSATVLHAGMAHFNQDVGMFSNQTAPQEKTLTQGFIFDDHDTEFQPKAKTARRKRAG